MNTTFSPDSLNRKIAKLGLTFKSGRIFTGNLYRVDINKELAESAQEWCQRTFEDEWVWSSPTQTDWSSFYFKTSEDALAFKLAFVGSLTA